MEDAALFEQVYEGNGRFFNAIAQTPVTGDGFRIAIAPSCPERSVLNCVSYEDTVGLRDALVAAQSMYEAHAVHAWTVWVPAVDRAAADLLAEAGHKLDGAPQAMGMVLADGANVPPAPETADPSPVGPINDEAYGYEGSFTAALSHGMEDSGTRTYLAEHDGEPACCVVTLDHGDDCHIGLVATRPEAQRRGLAGRLLAGALAAAAGRGLRTTTLIASAAGQPVYERLGYRPLGTIEMWERRKS